MRRLREPVCQEELCNLGLDLSMNLNQNSILTHPRPIPDVRLGHTLTRHIPRARKIPSCRRSYHTRGQCRANSTTAPGPVYSVITTDQPLSLRRNPAAILADHP